MFDTADAVAKLGTMSRRRVSDRGARPSMIQDLDPKAQSLEGYLFSQ